MTSLKSRWSRLPVARAVGRAAAVSFASAVALLVFAGPATANTTIPIKADHVPTTAAEFGTHECDPDQLPETPGKDGWHFVLPSEGAKDAEFVSVTLTYEDADGNSHTVNGIVGTPTNKHAVAYTPEGWTLTAGSAEITGETEQGPTEFNLSHTCPAPKVTPSPSVSPTESPTVEPSESPTESPSESDSPSQSPSGSVAPSESPEPPGGDLPVTGLAVGGMVLTGAGMVAAGIAMRALRRRKDAEASEDAGDEETDV